MLSLSRPLRLQSEFYKPADDFWTRHFFATPLLDGSGEPHCFTPGMAMMLYFAYFSPFLSAAW